VNGNLPTIKQMTAATLQVLPVSIRGGTLAVYRDRWGDAAIGEILQNLYHDRHRARIPTRTRLSLDQLSDQWREATRQQYLPQLAHMDRVRDFAHPLLNPRTRKEIFSSPLCFRPTES